MMRPRPSRLRLLSLLAATALLSACPAGSADLTVAENVNELGEAIFTLREDNALLHQQLDSLRMVVARQDSTLRQIANLAGVAVRW